MENLKLPHSIRKYITNTTTYIKDTKGSSCAEVYYLTNTNKDLYLKVEKTNFYSKHEQHTLSWLQNKLPVPRIIAQCENNGCDYLLMTKVPGVMACSKLYLDDPIKLVRLLAEGIQMLQEINVTGCSYFWSINNKLILAKKRIQNHEIDMKNWQKGTQFKSPEELYEYLVEHQPEEEYVFSHGDYCLPNIFLKNDQVSGFVDFGKAGIADKWQDIALCVRSIVYNLQDKQYTDLLFKYLGIEPDYEKISYYILLNELLSNL